MSVVVPASFPSPPLKLGARHALGVDIDSASVRSTRENSSANAVDPHLETGLGSVAEILAGQFSLARRPSSWPIFWRR